MVLYSSVGKKNRVDWAASLHNELARLPFHSSPAESPSVDYRLSVIGSIQISRSIG